MNQEIWKDIEEYKGKYQVSNWGRVKSFCVNKKDGKLLTPQNERGYFRQLFGKKHYSVNRLVAKCFVENPFDYTMVDHIDGNTTNNNANNLRWVSPTQNSMNTHISSSNTSGFKGVCYKQSKNRWCSCIFINGKRIEKEFDIKEDAINWRQEMTKLHYDNEFYREKTPSSNLSTMNNIDGEEWKDIKDSNGMYQISNMGRVKNYKLNKVLKDYHSVVYLSLNSTRTPFFIYRLVATYFVKNNNLIDYNQVDHIDGNPYNNKASNLRWVNGRLNSLNRKIRTDNTSTYKGVYYRKDTDKWSAFWMVNGKKVAKVCNSKDEAIELRKQMVDTYYSLEHYKEF